MTVNQVNKKIKDLKYLRKYLHKSWSCNDDAACVVVERTIEIELAKLMKKKGKRK